MTKQAFPVCCGITVIAGYNGKYMPGYKLTDSQKEHILLDLKEQIKTSTSVGLLLIALNNLQVADGIGDIAKKAGFVDLTGPCFHPGHGHRITLLGYEIHPGKREKKDGTFPPGASETVEAKPEKKSSAGLFSKDTGETTPLKKTPPPGYRIGRLSGRLYKIKKAI